MLLILANKSTCKKKYCYWWSVHILFIFVNRNPEVGLQGKQTWMQGQGRDDGVQGVESPVPPSEWMNAPVIHPSLDSIQTNQRMFKDRIIYKKGIFIIKVIFTAWGVYTPYFPSIDKKKVFPSWKTRISFVNQISPTRQGEVVFLSGLHNSFHPTIRDGSTWSKFGAHGEHGDVFLFSNLHLLHL